MTTLIGATGLGDCSGSASPCAPNSSNFLFQFNGTYYATDVSNNLYRVNPVTGAETLIGPTGMPATPFKLESMNPDGTVKHGEHCHESLFISGGKLYDTFDAGTIDFSAGNITPVVTPALYLLDVTAGTATRIGSTAFELFMSIDLDDTVYSYSAPDEGLLTLDLATGNTKFVAGVDPSVDFISGAAPVSEPRTFVFLAAGLLIGGALCGGRRSCLVRRPYGDSSSCGG